MRFPRTLNELGEVKRGFVDKFDFPGVIGIVDGTHVAIAGMPRNIENAFVDRRGIHSLTVQLICDSNMMIANVNARYPGSTHDAHVFANSRVYTFVESLYHDHPNDMNFLIGMNSRVCSLVGFIINCSV